MVAMPELKKPRVMTPEEFLEWEYHQEGRYEYADGRIIEMAGESPEHNEISGNIYREIGNVIQRPRCKVYFAEVRVRVAGTRYRYPDVTALCGTPQFDAARPRTLLNPQIVIEVLSGSTRHIDLSEKLQEYLALGSVTDYLVFDQEQVQATHYRPAGPLAYTAQIYTAVDSVISLEPIGVTLNLADAYSYVDLPASQGETSEAESETDDTAL